MKQNYYLFAIVGFGILLSGCSSSEQAISSQNTANESEQLASTDRSSYSEIEELFWARRDSATMNFTQADVDFMQGMIGHHAQALIMSSLAKPNEASPSVQTLASRIINAQKDEIRVMQQWLSDRDQTVPQVKIEGLNLILSAGDEPKLDFSEEAVVNGLVNDSNMEMEHANHMMDHSEHDMSSMNEEMDHSAMGHDMAMHDHSGMPGMLSQNQLDELAAAKGRTFDELFLSYMIQHHAGAITMVNVLVSQDGAAEEVGIGKLAGDINVDQKTEIERMRLMLREILEEEEGQ